MSINDVKTVYYPTKNVVNKTTKKKTIRRIHPTHVKNIHKTITRIENFYPVTESEENVNIVEEFNCGGDVNNPCCKRVKRS